MAKGNSFMSMFRARSNYTSVVIVFILADFSFVFMSRCLGSSLISLCIFKLVDTN